MNWANIGAFIPFAGIAMIVVIVWLGTREKQARVKARTELHKHLLDKFGSGTELAQFLETEGGKKMIEDLGKGDVSPKERTVRPMIAGTVLTCLGVAFLVLTYREPDLVIAGGIVLAIGIGLLIGAFVTLRLSKGWKADNERSTPDGQME